MPKKKLNKKKLSTRKQTKKVVKSAPKPSALKRAVNWLLSIHNVGTEIEACELHVQASKELRKLEASKAKIDSLRREIDAMPEGRSGVGGLSVLRKGKFEVAKFTNKEEAQELLKKVENGELTLP